MEIASTLPPELPAVAGPQGRAPPDFLQESDTEGDSAAAVLPFDFLLAQLGAVPLPAGDTLPQTGNALPVQPPGLPGLGAPAPGVLGAAQASAPLGAQLAVSVELLAAESGAAPAPTGTAAQPFDTDFSLEPPAQGQGAPEPPRAGAETGAAAALAELLPGAADAELPDASQARPAPLPAPVDLTEPQPAARVLAALAAATTARQAESGPARETSSSPVVAEPAVTASDAEGTALALDAQRDRAAGLARALESPPPLAIGDAQSVRVKTARGTEPQALPTVGIGASTDAPLGPSAALSHAAYSIGGTSAPTAAAGPPAAAHAPPPHPEGSVDTTAARWHDALASRVHWLVDHDVGEARIKLNPPELGALDVKISLQDDKTFVHLTAASSAARDELAQSLPRLRELLSANGLELGGATVSGGQDQRSAPYAQAERSVAEVDAGPIAVAQRQRASTASSSQIDVFA